jgi:hypothetical protein
MIERRKSRLTGCSTQVSVVAMSWRPEVRMTRQVAHSFGAKQAARADSARLALWRSVDRRFELGVRASDSMEIV